MVNRIGTHFCDHYGGRRLIATAGLALAFWLAGGVTPGLRAGDDGAPDSEPHPPLAPPAPPAPPPAADEDLARESEIARLLRMVLDERTELAAMRRDHRQKMEALQTSQFALERSIAAWDAEIAAAQKNWQSAADRSAELQAQLQARRAVQARWLAQMRVYPDWLEQHVQTGADFDRAARAQAAEELAAHLKMAAATPANGWQTISRLQEAEESLARTMEIAPVRLTADREVDGLRIGAVLLLAPDENGGAVAIGPGDRAQATTAVPAAQAGGLTMALQILQRRRSPDFTDVFFPALPAPAPAPDMLIGPKGDAAPPPVTSPTAPSPAATPLPAPIAPRPDAEYATVDAPPADTAEPDPVARLHAVLTQVRAAKAAFAQAAATKRQAQFGRVGSLETIEAERGRALRTWQAAIVSEQRQQANIEDQLQLAAEQDALFRQALEGTRDQLLERLTGSLEAAAQPALAIDLADLRGGAPAAEAEAPAAEPVTADPAAADAAITRLMQTQLRMYERLLAGGRAATRFTLEVKLADGRLVQANCLQVSLGAGFYADPQSQQAGVLVSDARQAGIWRGQVKGLSGAQQTAIRTRLLTPGGGGLLPVDVSGGAAVIQATNQGNLLDWFDAGGRVMWPLLCVALAGLVLVIERAVALLRLQGSTRDLLQRVETALQSGRYAEAQQWCDPTRGPVQRVLHAALIHRQDSRTVIEDAIQASALGELPQLQKGLGMIALLAGLAPLLGLLGTVTGMINTFQMVNLFGSSDTRFLAGGISEALITTEFGLVIAIPLVFCHGILVRLSERILTTIELGAAMVVQRLGGGNGHGAADAALTPSAAGTQPETPSELH